MSEGGDEWGDYPVGYGRPPFHTRFQKGRSGNPRGRPRGAKTLASLLHKALDRRITVEAETGPRRITKREAIVTQLVDRSAQADLRATRLLLDTLRKLEALLAPTEFAPEEDAREILRRKLDRLAAAMAEPPPDPTPAAEADPATDERGQGEHLPGDDNS